MSKICGFWFVVEMGRLDGTNQYNPLDNNSRVLTSIDKLGLNPFPAVWHELCFHTHLYTGCHFASGYKGSIVFAQLTKELEMIWQGRFGWGTGYSGEEISPILSRQQRIFPKLLTNIKD